MKVILIFAVFAIGPVFVWGQFLRFPSTARVMAGGMIKEAAEASHHGRITHFITGSRSPAVRIYARDSAKNSKSEGWDGECAGKWLYAASKCLERTGDPELKRNLLSVADFIVSNQDTDGYMGTYNDTARFTGNPIVLKESFDLWMNGYIMQGLMQLYRVTGYRRYLQATCKLADLCIRTFGPGKKNVAYSGGWNGMASGCVLEHFVDLYELTGRLRYLAFANYCYAALNARPDLRFESSVLGDEDLSQLGHGKMYEMLHCFVGVAKLYRAKPRETLYHVITAAWSKVKGHVNPAGGPSGGVGVFYECYDPSGIFSPYAYSETCAVMDWLRLNKELLKITGDPKYASEIEKTAYNAVPGARFADGYGWVYHTVLNGFKNRTGEFACCSSSGSILAEELPEVIYGLTAKGLQVNLFAASSLQTLFRGVAVGIEQLTAYPFEGKITIRVDPARPCQFRLSLCIPEWASDVRVETGGRLYRAKGGEKLGIDRVWKAGDEVVVRLPMIIRMERREMASGKEDTVGKTIYGVLYRGPLLYASHIEDTREHPNPLRFNGEAVDNAKEGAAEEINGHTVRSILLGSGRWQSRFVPYAVLNRGNDDDYRLTWFSLARAQPGITIVETRCENRIDPMDIDVPTPAFGWTGKSARRNSRQTAYEIEVAQAAAGGDPAFIVWNSGKIAGDASFQVTYRGKPLRSFTRYRWTVRVYDQNGVPGRWSRPAYFETAMLTAADWQAHWIGDGSPLPENDADFYKDRPMPLFKKIIQASSPVASARLYISGLGYYEAYLNGKKIGDAVLDPGFTKYSQRVLYSVYDVSGYFKTGSNVLGVMVGSGWWNPAPIRMFGSTVFRDFQQTGSPCVIAQLRIMYRDGTVETVRTDGSWYTASGPVLFNSVYLGEHDDGRLERDDFYTTELTGWKAALIVAGGSGRLAAQAQPAVKIIRVIKPLSVAHLGGDTVIADMGENFAGVAAIRVKGAAGNTVTLRYGEALFANGRLNYLTSVAGQIKEIWHVNGGPGAPKTAWQEDRYTLKGGVAEQWHPRFTFHSFRYVEISGWPGSPGVDDIDGLVLSADVEECGQFSCSNPMFNQLHEVVKRTFRSNLFSIQSDCPAREKMGYGADIVVTAGSYIFNYGMDNFYRKTINDFANDQQPDGGITEIAPFTGIAVEGPGGNAGPPGWELVFPYLQEQLYQFYGDTRPIRQYYPAFLKQMRFLESKAVGDLFERDIADHAAIDEKPVAFDASLFYYHHACLAVRFATLLDRQDDAAHFRALAERIKAAIIKKFMHPATGGFANETESAMAFALWYGIAPDPANSFDKLLKAIHERQDHISTGIFATKMLFDVLRAMDRNDVAYRIADRRDYPGWGYMLSKGATTLWESWDYPDNAGSQNHPMFGSMEEWFYRSLLGINPASPGFKTMVIKPQPAGDLRSASGRYHSIMGDITCSWSRTGDGFSLQAGIPCNTTAEIWLLAGRRDGIMEGGRPVSRAPGVLRIRRAGKYEVITVGSGNYRFTAGP